MKLKTFKDMIICSMDIPISLSSYDWAIDAVKGNVKEMMQRSGYGFLDIEKARISTVERQFSSMIQMNFNWELKGDE